MPGVWGQKPSDAIRAPPSQPQTQTSRPVIPSSTARTNNNNSNNYNNSKSRGGGGRSVPGNNRDRNTPYTAHGRGAAPRSTLAERAASHSKPTNTSAGHQNTSQGGATLCAPGSGETPDQQKVRRYTHDTILKLRHCYVDAPVRFEAPVEVHWIAQGRMEAITSRAPRKTGDVSKLPTPRRPVVDTAPALEDCKPLQVNDDTRWKSKAFDKNNKEKTTAQEETDEDVLKRALLILNKLSLTTFEKLSDAFIATGIGRSKECLSGAIAVILEKAQTEPHFSHMYAMLCLKLSKTEFVGSKKLFKRLLLTQCQDEFEQDINSKIAQATTEKANEPEEQAYMAALIKKKYLGHMRFIGELYLGDLIKVDIMLWCLIALLEDFSEEEKVECFCKLMSTIGYLLEQQSALLLQTGKGKPAEDLATCWTTVHNMVSSKQVSPRMKFMLLDLIDMRDNSWVTRRKEETAMTIDQIHQEVAKEEAIAASIKEAETVKRSSSRRSLVIQRSGSLKPIVDDEGFVHVVPRAASFSNLSRSVSETATPPTQPAKNIIGRSQSFSVAPKKQQPSVPKPTKTFPSVIDVKIKAKSVFKEFFVSGETSDALVSLNELVGVGHAGSIERGAKVVETGCLLVMEMKQEDVQKMMVLISQCLKEGKLEKTCLTKALSDPLEMLNDIEIDAPFSRSHLATIVAGFIKDKEISLDFLLSAPEDFRSSGRSASFAAMVLKKVAGEVTDADFNVVQQLMSEIDMNEHGTAKAFVASI